MDEFKMKGEENQLTVQAARHPINGWENWLTAMAEKGMPSCYKQFL
jgi:hypothetical protein